MRKGHAKRVMAVMLFSVLTVGTVIYLRTKSDDTLPAASVAKAPSYHCPMHPTMVSDRPGDCPICSMRMVATEEEEGQAAAQEHAAADPPATAPGGKKKVIYRSTMNPTEVSDRPGKDSMGMEMVPEEVEEGAGAESAVVGGHVSVKISAQKRQLIGVRTAPVERGPFTRTIRTVGRVTYDESRLRNVTTRIGGWVQRLYANTTGQLVKEGEPLLTVYSPELVASAQEYLVALRGREQLAASGMAGDTAERLVASARRRLLLFDITPQQIKAFQESGEVPTTMTLHAPISGNVIARNVTQGDRIEPGMKLLDIAELSRVWVLADIYEYELPFLQLGQSATMSLSYLPGRTFEGRITFIYPVVSETTRTVKVRLEFSNADFTLKPEMYAQVEIHADLGERLSVPDSAVISTGTRDVVFVDRGEGHFDPREVKLGIRLPDRFEVLSGLSAGEPVLVSGNFLVDSESKLKAALTAVGPAQAGEGSGHTH